MPPHGGHHHGGGGHHGGHRGGGWTGGWGPGWVGPGVWYTEPAYAELVVPSCPSTLDPVQATDGRVYDNECLARAAGVAVVKRVPPKKLAGIGDIAGVPNVALIAGAGIVAFLLLRRRRR